MYLSNRIIMEITMFLQFIIYYCSLLLIIQNRAYLPRYHVLALIILLLNLYVYKATCNNYKVTSLLQKE